MSDTGTEALHAYEMRKNKWIKDRLEELGKKSNGLARALKLPSPRITDIINGTRRLQASEVPPLAAFLELSENDVLARFNGGPGDATLSQSLKSKAKAVDGTIENTRADRERLDIEELHVRASMGAGAMVETPEEAVKTVWSLPRDLIRFATSSDADRLKILTVIGDSMEPTFRPLDKIMVDTLDLSPTPPDIFVVWDGAGLVVKRVEFIPHSDPMTVRLFSDNEKYKPYQRVVDEAYIQGRVLGKWLWT